MSSEWKPITILNPHWEREKNFLCLSSNSLSQKLWGTDAARRVPHRSPTWPNARCSVRRDCLHIDAMSELFFFSDSHRLNSIRVDLASIHADSARSGPYQSNRVISADDRNRLKLALNHAEIAEIGFEWVPNILNLSFINFILNICCFFCVFFFVFVFCFVFLAFFFLCFVNQDHSNVFFKNILIVKIYRKYK